MLLKTTTLRFILLAASLSFVASHGTAQTTARDYCNHGVARQKKGDLDGALEDYSRAIELNPHDATPYNDRALVKIAKGDLDGALEDYDRALEISPRNIEIRDNRGVAKQKKGDLDGALADYNIAIKLYKNYARAYSHRAGIKIAKNDLDSALIDLNFAIAVNPKDAAAYNNRALIETAKGNPNAAAADFNRATALDPKYVTHSPPPVNKAKVNSVGAPNENRPIEGSGNSPDTGKNRENAAQHKDDLTDARPAPDNAPPVEIEPKNIAAVYDRDAAKQKKEDHNETPADRTPATELPAKSVNPPDDGNVGKKAELKVAPPEFSPSVEIGSKDAETPNSLELEKPKTGNPGGEAAGANRAAEPKDLKPGQEASVGPQKNQPAGGSADYHPATERDPTTAVGYDNRAQFRKTIGDLNGALADYNRAIEIDPKYAAAYNGRGNIERAKHDLDRALADYNRAIELNGANAVAYYNRGVTKQNKGDLDGALADFNPAIELDPKNAAVYRSRATAKAMKGDLDGALTDYNRAIEIDPKDPATYINRAGLLFSARKWDGALEDYNRFFDLSKDGQEYPRLYVWLIRARTGQTELANKELVDYLQHRGNTADWFSTVAADLLGGISDADLLAAAKSPDRKKESGQLCEAWFYIGMKKLMHGDQSGAQDSFNKSVATDEKNYTEYLFARAELKALHN